MKQKTKWKLLSWVMVILIMASLLGACNQGNKGDSETTQPTETQSVATQTEAGKDVWYKDKVDIKIDTPLGAWITDVNEGKPKDRIMKWIEETYNVNIIFNTIAANEQQKHILNLAAGTSGDMIQYGGWAMGPELTVKGAEEDLFVDFHELTNKYPERYPVMEKIINEDGYKYVCNYLYGLPEKAYGYWDYNVSNVPVGGELYNMKLMRSIGKTEADIPKTVDELVALLRHCKATKPGIIPFGFDARKGTRWDNLNATFFQTYGKEINEVFQNADGTWYNATIDAGNIPSWKLVQQLYAEGLIFKEEFTIDNYITDVFNEGNMLVHDCYMPHFATYHKLELEALQKLDPSYNKNDLRSNPNALKGPGGSVTQRWGTGDLFAKTVIPRSSKVPERALDIINFLCSKQGQLMAQYGLEGIHYTVDGNGNIVKNAEEIKKDREDIYARSLGVLPISYLHGCAWGFVKDYETNTYLDAGKNALNVQLAGVKTDALKGDDPLLTNWLESYNNFVKNVIYNPFWQSNIYQSSTMRTIESKMKDVQNAWFMKFVIGEKDPEKDWEEFVKEYNAAGAQQYLEDYSKNAAEAEKAYNKLFKK